MTAHALVLNADYRPLDVVPWERAMVLVLKGKADLVTDYADRCVRSPRATFPWPAVVRLCRYVHRRGRVRFNRRSVLARDGCRCQYCGLAPRGGKGPTLADLTIDHVIPRAQARDGLVRLRCGDVVPVTSWRNVAAACWPCNLRKGPRRPGQAGMALRQEPRVPTALDVLWMTLHQVEIPTEWKQFLPTGSRWAGYWDDELESS